MPFFSFFHFRTFSGVKYPLGSHVTKLKVFTLQANKTKSLEYSSTILDKNDQTRSNPIDNEGAGSLSDSFVGVYYWYYDNQSVRGPCSFDQLSELHQNGHLSLDTLISHSCETTDNSSNTEWMELSVVLENMGNVNKLHSNNSNTNTLTRVPYEDKHFYFEPLPSSPSYDRGYGDTGGMSPSYEYAHDYVQYGNVRQMPNENEQFLPQHDYSPYDYYSPNEQHVEPIDRSGGDWEYPHSAPDYVKYDSFEPQPTMSDQFKYMSSKITSKFTAKFTSGLGLGSLVERSSMNANKLKSNVGKLSGLTSKFKSRISKISSRMSNIKKTSNKLHEPPTPVVEPLLKTSVNLPSHNLPSVNDQYDYRVNRQNRGDSKLDVNKQVNRQVNRQSYNRQGKRYGDDQRLNFRGDRQPIQTKSVFKGTSHPIDQHISAGSGDNEESGEKGSRVSIFVNKRNKRSCLNKAGMLHV